MRPTKKEKLQGEFAAKVIEMARAAGATIVQEFGVDVFVLTTPLGEIRGRAIFGYCVAMRFTDPGTGKPEIATSDFNRFSHKWNIQGYRADAALVEFARRLRWMSSAPAKA